MNTPEKSSDEILMELFGMCTKGRYCKSVNSSSEESSVQSDRDSNDTPKKRKRKKKKKKLKKEKKKSSSTDNFILPNKSHKSKKKKSHKKKNENEYDRMVAKKNEPKIKLEEEHSILNSECKHLNISCSENKSKNYVDTVTGKTLTIDDVFNSLDIPSEDCISSKIIEQKDDVDNRLINKNKEGKHEINLKQMKNSNDDSVKTEENENVSKNQKNIADAFINDNETARNEIFDKSKTVQKKINIKNLKNSSLYEATMKEIAEREKLRAEKYEDGEISSSSNSSNYESFDSFSESVSELQNDFQDEDHRSPKHRRRSESHDATKSKHNARHRKKHKKKHSYHNCKSQEKVTSLDRNHSKRKSNSKHRRHRRDHPYNRSYTRSPSESSRSSSISSRSHNFRSRKRKLSRDTRRMRSRSRTKTKQSRSKSKSVEKIDKQKLLEIARKNAINLLKQGALPASVITNKDKIASIKAGGKTVHELTDFCKQLSKKDAEGQDSVSSESEVDSDEEKGKPFHHPFQIKERPAGIVMNIRNAVSLPTKTAQEKTLELSKQLSLQYPVSSGQQHRKNENEWVPVVKPKENSVLSHSSTVIQTSAVGSHSSPCYLAKPFAPTPYESTCSYPVICTNNVVPNVVMPPQQNVDISSIVAQRLEAIRRLSDNPQDPIGNNLIQIADSKMQVWAESKAQPGLFTGSTGVRPLTVAELASGYKAWAKKSQFTAAKPIYSDKGEALMKKMGWQPGEGLGKYKQGPSAPCEIDLKTDRKGLAEQPQSKSFKQPTLLKKAFEISQSKHPVSLLNEYCSRRKIGVPQYDCEEKQGAGRRKLFLFSVTVQGAKFTPKMPSTNKKQSKVEAATICLQSLGVLSVNVPS